MGPVLEERRRVHRYQCQNKPANPNFIEEADFTRSIVIEDLKLLFCFIPKISCTTWKRVLHRVQHNGTALEGNPHLYRNNKLSVLQNYTPAERKTILDTYYKAMFVREPFARLLSAFKNKVEWRGVERYRLFNSSLPDEDLLKNKFPTFVRYVVSHKPTSRTINQHWRSYEQMCPCEVNYDFIGHFENLGQEATHLLKTIGVDHYVTFPEYHSSKSRPYLLEYYSKLTRDDIFRLGKFYEIDFKLFGYDFPGPLQTVLDAKDMSEMQ